MKPKTYIFYVKEPPAVKKAVDSPGVVFERMKDLAKADQESFWVLGFNGGNREIYSDCLFIGGAKQCNVDTGILFKRLLNVGALSFITVHNHPGGNSKPSIEDISLTGSIKKIANVVKIELLDHIIIGDSKYFSFREGGLL